MTMNNFLEKILEFCDYRIIVFYNFLPFNNLDFSFQNIFFLHSFNVGTGCTKMCLWSSKSLGSKQSNLERSVNEAKLKIPLSDYNRSLNNNKNIWVN